MQANITPALNSVLSLMGMDKETNNTKEEPNNPHHKEIPEKMEHTKIHESKNQTQL